MSSVVTVSEKPLSCSIKPPQFLGIGDTQFHSGCAVIELSLPNMGSVDIGKITFVNNYTAHLSIKMKVHETTKVGKSHLSWKTGIHKLVLMPNAHCEEGSQGYFTLYPKDFFRPPLLVSSLRFVLYQPSPSWKTFSLEEIYVYPAVAKDSQAPSIPRWLLRDFEEMATTNDTKPRDQVQSEGLPDLDDLSVKMQQLWMITQNTNESVPNVDLGRFDVDGCYEINLLSYT
ncbi:nicolin-1-like [Clavelina lepadiformis]|uniref:nicolin-1-like n=1 Tax=Clavelina lepadiformis TaxID=159417 RepID=UPI0040438622